MVVFCVVFAFFLADFLMGEPSAPQHASGPTQAGVDPHTVEVRFMYFVSGFSCALGKCLYALESGLHGLP